METPEFEDHVICIMDLTVKKVGCVLLQAAYGCDRDLAHKINTDRWLLAPSENMRIYKIKKSDIPGIIKKFNNLSEEKNLISF